MLLLLLQQVLLCCALDAAMRRSCEIVLLPVLLLKVRLCCALDAMRCRQLLLRLMSSMVLRLQAALYGLQAIVAYGNGRSRCVARQQASKAQVDLNWWQA
jgi:hypothetical protein